jgi:hypothetical protein
VALLLGWQTRLGTCADHSSGAAITRHRRWHGASHPADLEHVRPGPPTVTHRYEIARRLSDGTRVVEPASSSFRWTVYIGRVAGTHPPGHPLAESFRLFTERQCAWRGSGSVGAQLVDQVAVIAHRREISLDGLGEDQTRTLTAPSCF